jgi:hypothetical protein
VRRSRSLRVVAVGLIAGLSFFAACGDDDGGGVRNVGEDGGGSGSGSGSSSGSGSGSGSGPASGVAE